MRDLAPCPGIEPRPPALEVQSQPLDHQGSPNHSDLKGPPKKKLWRFLRKLKTELTYMTPPGHISERTKTLIQKIRAPQCS